MHKLAVKSLELIKTVLLTRRGLLIAAGGVAFFYAVIVLLYVQSIPDIGIRSAFKPKILGKTSCYKSDPNPPQERDTVTMVGDIVIDNWPDLLHAPINLRAKLDQLTELPSWAEKRDEGIGIKVAYQKENSNTTLEGWFPLGKLPWEDLVPSILWFILKVMLFSVGALVFWKRPADDAAAQFFFLCTVTLGAFMGGYHWSHLAINPPLLLVFMVCAVLLPVASLHFYLLFPRKKRWLETHPRLTLTIIYGPPLAFLVTLMTLYFRLRWLVQSKGVAGGVSPSPQAIDDASDLLQYAIYAYLVVAAVWYLACVVALVHSFWKVNDSTERNQVKWILYGAVLALFPMSYSLYLAIWEPDKFGAGEATWPMFGASACVTAAFAISITRYRLMELDKIISSGMSYFLISLVAGLAYYAVVFIGMLISNQFIAGPKPSLALMVSTTALVVVLVLDLARTRFKKALDRRFSRDKSQLDRTLQRMGQAIQQLVDPVALAQKLLHTAAEQLGVRRGAVYLRQGEPPIYRLAGCVGPPPELSEMAVGFPLIEDAEQGKLVSTRARDSSGLSAAQRQLQFLGGEIAHPLVHEGRLLALLILGHKGTPYRTEDLDLLAAFAQITVLALESAEGHRTIEQLNRDLQAKLEKISEQQRRILALQTQLRRQKTPPEEPATVAETQPAVSSGGIVGNGPVIQQLLGLVRKVAATDAVVLIRGESGTGKELLAKAVHESSPRAANPFIKVHCAALSANLLESELFGHVKGAFTGAHKDKIGRFESANGGTLFLDEIGDISLEVQTKLLRVLQEKTIERVGSSESMEVDVRILAATHQDLETLIRQGRFREDLFYRLNVFPIRMPPLREHVEDIPELAGYFMRASAQRCRKEVTQIDDDVLAAFKGYAWPGNIRQLENVIERAVVITDGQAVTLNEIAAEVTLPSFAFPEQAEEKQSFVPEPAFNGKADNGNWRNERDRLDREQMVRALAAAAGNKAEAARALGIARSTLVSKLKKLGLS